MQWFKHDTGASNDAKIRKLVMRHGPIGYAVYFHCLELIMADVSESHLTFELEHDAEIIADNLKIQGNNMEAGVDIVNKIMHTITDLKLFESSSDRIFCLKLASRLDLSMTSNSKFRKKIQDIKVKIEEGTLLESHDRVMIGSCLSHGTVMQEENRTDRIEENKEELKEKKQEKKENPKSFNNSQSFETYQPPKKTQSFETYIKPEDRPVNNQPPINPVPTQPAERNYPTEWEFLLSHWNDQETLPEYRKMLCHESNAGEIKNWMAGYNLSEMVKAIDNYSSLIDKIETAYRYRTFKSFIQKGLDQFHDGAKPGDRFESGSSEEELETSRKIAEEMFG